MFGSKILLQWQTKINLNFLKNWSSYLSFYKVHPISSFHLEQRLRAQKPLSGRLLCSGNIAWKVRLHTHCPSQHSFSPVFRFGVNGFLCSPALVSCIRTVPKDAPRASCRLSIMFYHWATSSGLGSVLFLFLFLVRVWVTLLAWNWPHGPG